MRDRIRCLIIEVEALREALGRERSPDWSRDDVSGEVTSMLTSYLPLPPASPFNFSTEYMRHPSLQEKAWQ